jgi:hypothetical protein
MKEPVSGLSYGIALRVTEVRQAFDFTLLEIPSTNRPPSLFSFANADNRGNRGKMVGLRLCATNPPTNDK